MSAPPSIPASTADIKDEHLALSYLEGHDADTPSNISVLQGEKLATTTSIEKDVERGSETQEEVRDPNIVWWEEPADQDPENPMNWSAKKKWGSIAVLATCTLITPLASSIFAPGVPQVMRDFHSSNQELATFVVSVYILGFALGPLIIAPLSEMYGRAICYNVCNALFFVFSICCAVSNSYGMLVAFRFLMGCAGSAPLTIGGGTVADIMPVETRGKAMAIWAMGPLLGPVIGPVAGGYLIQAAGWRWVFWLLAILSGLFTILSLVCVRETYAPVLLKWKTARLIKETGNTNLRFKLDSGLSQADLFKRAIIRPSKMLVLSPVVLLLSLYMAVAYGIVYVLFTTFTFVFEERYGFDEGEIGLTYIPIGIGMILGLSVIGFGSDCFIKAAIKRSEKLTPEHRLPDLITIPGGACLPVGLFIYGWTAQYHTHWIVPLIGTIFVGVGLIACMMCIQTYIVDAFTLHAASAMAALTVLRSTAGALLPLGALKMYDKLGLGWGNSLLAFIALALVPVPVLFRRFGAYLRKRFAVDF